MNTVFVGKKIGVDKRKLLLPVVTSFFYFILQLAWSALASTPSLPTASVSRARWASTSGATGSGSTDAPGMGKSAGGAPEVPGARPPSTPTGEGSSTYRAHTIVAQNRLYKNTFEKMYKKVFCD